MTIKVKDTVINTDRFIYATIGMTAVQVWMEGLPATRQFTTISIRSQEEGEKILEEINEKMQKRVDKSLCPCYNTSTVKEGSK